MSLANYLQKDDLTLFVKTRRRGDLTLAELSVG